jgi:hypothetical protein
MKVIENSAKGKGDGKLVVLARVQETLSRPWSQKEAEAQETVISTLQKVLDNKYVMLRNTVLEGPDVPIPLILVGPPGVRVIYVSSVKGIYRAREEFWEALDDHTQRFQVAKPNLLNRTLLMARAVETFLHTRSLDPQSTEPVLLFSNPGVHVDSTRPAVRIVLADALDRFATSLVQSRAFLEPDAVQKIVASLTGENRESAAAGPAPERRDAFSFQELPGSQPKVSGPVVVMDRSEPSILRKIPFSHRQWLVLGMLLAVNITIITALLVLVLLMP